MTMDFGSREQDLGYRLVQIHVPKHCKGGAQDVRPPHQQNGKGTILLPSNFQPSLESAQQSVRRQRKPPEKLLNRNRRFRFRAVSTFLMVRLSLT